jgi:hypothetical protein
MSAAPASIISSSSFVEPLLLAAASPAAAAAAANSHHQVRQRGHLVRTLAASSSSNTLLRSDFDLQVAILPSKDMSISSSFFVHHHMHACMSSLSIHETYICTYVGGPDDGRQTDAASASEEERRRAGDAGHHRQPQAPLHRPLLRGRDRGRHGDGRLHASPPQRRPLRRNPRVQAPERGRTRCLSKLVVINTQYYTQQTKEERN